jgi:shikimate dehydrogenase
MTDTSLRTHSLFLIGEGIGKSRTPALHEREGAALGMPVTYRIVDALELGLTAADLPDVLRWAQRLGCSGFNVTHPFKQAIIPHLDGLSDRAEALGAVNTVVFRDGKATGHNTDWCGFQRPFQAQLPGAGQGTVVQVGSGGAGAAVAYALLDNGASRLILHDVFPDKAQALAERMGGLFGADRVCVGTDLADSMAQAEGVVHCTPTGMATHPGCAVPEELLRPEQWVAEIVYFPLETELVRMARAKGCRTVDGGGMAAEQAVEAFYQFTGVQPDAARMHAHLREMVGGAPR